MSATKRCPTGVIVAIDDDQPPRRIPFARPVRTVSDLSGEF
jgi:hypothetical protein